MEDSSNVSYSKRMYRLLFLSFISFLNYSVNLTTAQEFRDSSGNLETVSEAPIPSDSILVDLSYNRIIRLHDGDFVAFLHLQNLYLATNQINIIGKKLVMACSNYCKYIGHVDTLDIGYIKPRREVWFVNTLDIGYKKTQKGSLV